MNLLDFKNILINNNIYLSDAQLRISNYRFNNLVNNNKLDESSIFDKLCQKNKCLIDIFINSLVNNDNIKINYILNSII